jgi:intein/homing endonuclease
MIHYFLRGYFDGDGYVGTKRHKSIQIASSYENKWKNLFFILTKIGVTNKRFRKYISKKGHRHSSVSLNKEGSIKFLNFIYKGKKFGLSRKYNAFRSIYPINLCSV